MNTSKLIAGTVAGTVAGLLSSGLIFGFALKSYLSANASMNTEFNMLWLILGHLVFAMLITYIFIQWAEIKTATGGARAGAIIGFLGILGIEWMYYGATDLFTGGALVPVVDAIGSGVVWAVSGAAIGWVLGRGNE